MTRALDAVPISSRTWERVAMAVILLAILAALTGIAIMLGVPQALREQWSRGVASAGFEVKRVEVEGLARMDRLTVYGIAFDQQSRSMADVDLDAVRNQLLRHGWIAEARVTRRLPETLVVRIVERVPAALWQRDGRVYLVDRAGTVLSRVSPRDVPNLPLLIGPGANLRTASLEALTARSPRLKPLLAGATWVGDRRWDLNFQTGETLALPEGPRAAGAALAKFDAMDREERLLGRGFLRFDMRAPDKMFVRLDRSKATITPPASATAPAPKPEETTKAPKATESETSGTTA